MNLRRVVSSHIVRQLLSVLLPLAVLPILILGIVLLLTGREATQTAVLRDYQVIAQGAAREIDMLVDSSKNMLRAMAATVGVTDTDPWKQETAVIELRLSAPSFQQLVYMDMEGKVRASGTLDYALEDSAFTHTMQEAVEHFRRDPNQSFYQSSVHFIDERFPAVTMAVPVRKLGSPVGILTAQVNFRSMWNLVDDIRIGHTGQAYVVSEQGVILAHFLPKYVLKHVNWSDRPPVKQVLSGTPGSLDYDMPEEGKILAAFAPLKSIGWGVVVEQQSAEAYATIDVMTRQAWGIMLISAVIAVVIGILVARSIVKPVLQLAKGTRRISRGELSHRIDLQRKDEIGQLAGSFNEMAASLKESYEGLEQKVVDRTSQLRQALEEVERLSEMKSKFISEVAHELRTPLTSIQGYAETLIRLRDRMTDEKKQECAETISRESIRLTRMINNLLDMARIESGNIQLEKKPVQMESVVQASIVSATPTANQKKIRLQQDNANDLPCVLADHDAVRRVFDNLIGNAMKFTPAGGAVTVAMTPENGHMLVRISDTGIGIPEQDLDNIFDPFYQVKSPGAQSRGTGLGLPIVKSLIEELGGEISADSTPGQGSVMTFTLPTTSEKEHVHGV